MSGTLAKVKELVARGAVRATDHAYDRFEKRGIYYDSVISGLAAAVEIEDYPDHVRGPCVLVLQEDEDRQPVHVVWGFTADDRNLACIITAYRPHEQKWETDFRTRKG